MHIDYLIVGQGIAGTVLAHTLIQKGCRVVVISDDDPNRASLVAAGLYNPITGKRASRTWKAAELFPFMEIFYKDLETILQTRFMYPKPVYKPFASIEEQNTWLSANEGEAFINTNIPIDRYANYLHTHTYGGFETTKSGHIDLPVLLESFRRYLADSQRLISGKFDPKKLEVQTDSVLYESFTAKKIIFCEGIRAQTNPYFSWLPLVACKGEILKVAIERFTDEVIFNKQVFIVPTADGLYRVGSTYEWNFEHTLPTEKGREDLQQRLTEMIKMPFAIKDHLAGIRPTVKDRKPLIGLHPEHAAVAIFNGMGTKGISLAPFFAGQMAEYLLENKQLIREVNIERYYSLYSHSETRAC
jgi:glycine oxidase